METQTQVFGKEPNGSQSATSLVATVTRLNYLDTLKGVKQEKLGIFMPYFGEQTAEFISKCSGRGENSWKKVMDRIHSLDNANDDEKLYINRLYEIFELEEIATISKVIGQIGIVRRELGLKIEEQTSKYYLQQLSRAFLIEKVRDEGNMLNVTGYKLLFKLMPDTITS